MDKAPLTSTEHADSRSSVYVQGFSWRGTNPAQRQEVLEAACDYRGDVTLTLRTGDSVVGFLFQLKLQSDPASATLYPVDGASQKDISLEDIVGVTFSGKDAAAGTTWEAWVKRWQETRAAREAGAAVGTIGLFPDEEPNIT